MPLTDYPHWESLSRKLSKEESENPYLVIEELFDYAHLPDLRHQLWEWLRTTVTGDFTEGLDRRERIALLFLYEKIEKLVEAAHLIQVSMQKKKRDLPSSQ